MSEFAGIFELIEAEESGERLAASARKVGAHDLAEWTSRHVAEWKARRAGLLQDLDDKTRARFERRLRERRDERKNPAQARAGQTLKGLW